MLQKKKSRKAHTLCPEDFPLSENFYNAVTLWTPFINFNKHLTKQLHKMYLFLTLFLYLID